MGDGGSQRRVKDELCLFLTYFSQDYLLSREFPVSTELLSAEFSELSNHHLTYPWHVKAWKESKGEGSGGKRKSQETEVEGTTWL